MDDELKPLTPDVKALLDAERRAPDPSHAARDRVRTRLWASLGLLGVAGTASAATGGTPPLGTSGLAPKLLGKALWAKLGLGFVVGAAGLGLGLHLALRKPTGPAQPATPPSLAAPVRPVVTPPPVAAPEPPEAPEPPKSIRPGAPTASDPIARPVQHAVPSPSNDLAAERRLVEEGRMSLAGGQSARALKTLERHAQRFPHGQLVEERESLWIRALAAAGRRDEARARGARFHARFPRSLFRPAVDSTLQSLP